MTIWLVWLIRLVWLAPGLVWLTVIRLEVFLKVRLLMVRLLMMMIRLEMFLKAPARGWGDGCLNLNVLMRKVNHLPKAGRDPEDNRFCGEGARASRRAVQVSLVSAAAALPAVALGAPPSST